MSLNQYLIQEVLFNKLKAQKLSTLNKMKTNVLIVDSKSLNQNKNQDKWACSPQPSASTLSTFRAS